MDKKIKNTIESSVFRLGSFHKSSDQIKVKF